MADTKVMPKYSEDFKNNRKPEQTGKTYLEIQKSMRFLRLPYLNGIINIPILSV